MSANRILILAALAGIFLSISGILFPIAIPSEPLSAGELAHMLQANRLACMIHAGTVLLSGVVFLPVLVQLAVRLYPLRPGTAIAGSSILGVAIFLQTVAVLLSLARWNKVVPLAASGNPEGLLLLDTLQMLWLAVDLPGTALFYVASTVLTVGLWSLDTKAAWSLGISTALFIGAFLASFISPGVGTALAAASIFMYGFSYMMLGYLTTRLPDDRWWPFDSIDEIRGLLQNTVNRR